MNLRHTVRAVGAYDRQMRHANLLGGPLFDEAHALNTTFIDWKYPADIAKETSIDFVDDLQLPWQQLFEPCHRPLLKGLGQQCVVGVRQGVLCDTPGVVPPKLLLVNQDSHQLRHCQSRVRIVQLERDFLWKRVPIQVVMSETSNRVGQGTG